MIPVEVHPVSHLTSYLRDLLDEDETLGDYWLTGEISNLSHSGSGHYYFTLKDNSAQIRCVMFKKDAAWLTMRLDNGKAVVAHGSVSLYEATGNLQFYVDIIEEEGQGALSVAFERLKAGLEAQGLFAVERKRPLPLIPRRVGLVTSPQAAALQDILTVLARRFPLLTVVLAPAAVQGKGAGRDIARGILALNMLEGEEAVDVIIVARGGGSIEELWAFNEEIVARAAFASRVPVVSGVGHETDVTIIDLVADVRAPTPSAAAELVSPDVEELHYAVGALRRAMLDDMAGRLAVLQDEVVSEQQRLERLSPAWQLTSERQRITDMVASMSLRLEHRIALDRERIKGFGARLEALSPLQILRRGYAIVRNLDTGEVVTSAASARAGDHLEVRVSDGAFGARVESPRLREVGNEPQAGAE